MRAWGRILFRSTREPPAQKGSVRSRNSEGQDNHEFNKRVNKSTHSEDSQSDSKQKQPIKPSVYTQTITRVKTEDPAVRGESEFIKDSFKDIKKSVQKLNDLENKTHNVLMKLSTHMPLDFFPDDIIIDLNNITFIIRDFIQTETVHAIMIRNISSVTVSHDFFFAKLRVVDKTIRENPVEISWLNKEEAERARRIIQGLIVCGEQDVDLSKVDTDKDIAGLIEGMGKSYQLS